MGGGYEGGKVPERVTGFQLSPGITPELTGAVVIALPLAIGIGYLVWGRVGFELTFAGFAILMGAIKGWTDLADPPDLGVALAAIGGGATWVALRGTVWGDARSRTYFGFLVGLVSLVAGLVKVQDFLDPFDLLLADCAIVCGLALWSVAFSEARRRYDRGTRRSVNGALIDGPPRPSHSSDDPTGGKATDS